MRKPRQRVKLNRNIKTILAETLYRQLIPSDIIVRENRSAITHYHSYGGLSPFFKGLTLGILYGTACQHGCPSTLWLPPRIHCPDCWGKMDWKTIDTSRATVYTYSTTNLPGAGFKASTPCPLISVEIPGVCTKFMSYLSQFGEGEPYINMPVHPVFRTHNPTYTILDISWIPRD